LRSRSKIKLRRLHGASEVKKIDTIGITAGIHMEFEKFKAGHWVARYQYKSFEPVPVNHDWTWKDAKIHQLMESANHALGELNAFSLIVPDIDIFIQMHVVKEAQTSSRIEGTRTGMDEALLSEEYVRPERRNDWREVRNYITALNTAVDKLTDLPLSNRLLKETEQQIQTLGRRTGIARAALDVLYRRPIIAAAELEGELAVSRSTVHLLIKELTHLGIITEITGQMRGRVYSFERYYNLFLGDGLLDSRTKRYR